ncbi:hypothetical protein [Paenibacillus sp. UNC451MF]|uniref:hypothetical protein n=1 Tax=Paenibacillus sp. UNC451MF TaxID=1449063 RepID=UPI00048F9B1F|nr:hypothetical protein [Paenibacillus sp. UNC451MF]
MKAISLLANMETSRYSPFMIGSRKTNYKWIALGMFVLLTVSMVMMNGVTTVNGLLFAGVLNVFVAMILFIIMDGITLSSAQEREWWLLLPYPRLVLVLGKALGLLRIAVHLILYLAIIRIIQYALSAGLMHHMQSAAVIDLLYLIGANALLLIAGLPIIISLGLLVTVFQVSWVRVLLILAGMYMFMPSLILTFMAGNTEFALSNLTPSNLARFAMILLLVGCPLSVLSIWLATSVGMKHMGKVRFTRGFIPAIQRQSILQEKKLERNSRWRTPFWSLVAIERQRYRWFGLQNHRLGRIIAGTLMLVVAILSYRSAGEFFELVSFLSMIMIGSYMLLVIYYLNRQVEFQRGPAHWWITLPYSRSLLLGSRVVAYLSVMLPYVGTILLCAIIGAAVRQWIDPMPGDELLVALRYAYHYALVFIPLIILYIIALQGFPAFLNRSWLMIFAIPMYGGYVLGFQLAQSIITPRHMDGWTFRSGPAPDFGYHLLLIYGLAVPYALFCFWLGCKYMNRYAIARDTVWLGKVNK